MVFSKNFVIILFVGLMLVGSVSAASWYVDKDASGSNSGTSWSNAWENFTVINWSSILPGDTLYFSGGVVNKTYYEEIYVRASGEPGNRITISKGVDPGHDGDVILAFDPDNYAENGVYVYNRQHVVVRGFTIIGRPRGVFVQGRYPGALNDVVIEDNYILVSEQGGVAGTGHGNNSYDFVQNVVVRNNYLTTPTYSRKQTDTIYFQFYENLTIEGNFINPVNTWSDGICSSGHTPHIDAIQVNRGKDLTVRYNYIKYNVNRSCSQTFMNADNIGETNYYGNIIESWVPGAAQGMQGAFGTYVGSNYPPWNSHERINFYNNLVIGDAWYTVSLSGDYRVKNNIFVNMRDSSHRHFSVTPAIMRFGTLPHWDWLNNNIYFNYFGESDGILLYAPYNTSSYVSVNLAEIQALGGESNGLYTDPLLSDFLSNDFYLQSASPAIDAGIDLGPPFNFDKDGNLRTGAWDIGVYEFGGTVPSCIEISGEYCSQGQLCDGGSFVSSSEGGLCCIGGVCSDPVVCSDVDGDGYGDPASGMCSYSGLDCNDAADWIYPGAVEVCGNGVDEDCDGEDLLCPGNFPVGQWVEAEAGVLVSPMVNNGGVVSSSVDNSGTASYSFDVVEAGSYVLDVNLVTSSGGTNSFFVGLDGVEDIFDSAFPLSSELDVVSWRGGGDDVVNEFDPKVFSLSAGVHTFVFRSRERGTGLDSLRLSLVGSVCVPADGDCDGCVDLNEISLFVGLWLNGEVDLQEVSDAVVLWLSGTGCS